MNYKLGPTGVVIAAVAVARQRAVVVAVMVVLASSGAHIVVAMKLRSGPSPELEAVAADL